MPCETGVTVAAPTPASDPTTISGPLVGPSGELPLPFDAETILRQNLRRLTRPDLAERVLATPLRRVGLKRGLPSPAGLELCGAAICSATNPDAEAASWAAGFDLDQFEVGVLLGLGLAHPLRALRRRSALPLLVLEPSLEVIRLALSLEPLPLDGIQIVDNLTSLREALEPRLAVRDVVGVLAWPAYRRLFPELLQGARAATAEAASLASVTALTLEKRLRLWTRNLIANLAGCVGQVAVPSLAGLLRGRPAVLVAAGPSLDRNIEELRRARDRAVVIAVNTSVRALEKAGVRADLLLAVEVLDLSSQLAELDLNRRCPRALAVTANPGLFQSAEGPVFPFSDLIPFFNTVCEEAGLGSGLPMGGSVSNAAFSLALLLGADPIVLCGQDLAYTGGRVYAAGTVFGAMTASVRGSVAELDHLEAKKVIAASLPEADTTLGRRSVEQVPAWGGGGQVYTTLEFNYFRANFERYARTAGGRLINATEGGAHIRGFEERRLGEVLDGLPSAPLPSWPDAPKLAAPPVDRILRSELQVAREALAQCRSATAAGDDHLVRVRAALASSPILQAYTWPTVQRALAEETSVETFSQRLAEDSEECAALLTDALDRLRHA